jgi:hypothetical protein
MPCRRPRDDTSANRMFHAVLERCSSRTTPRDLSRLPRRAVSDDKVSRFLSEKEMYSRAPWHLVKPLVRELEKEADREEGMLIVDYTIKAKPYTGESEVACWHYDYSKGTRN